jgi:hypothetical protein
MTKHKGFDIKPHIKWYNRAASAAAIFGKNQPLTLIPRGLLVCSAIVTSSTISIMICAHQSTANPQERFPYILLNHVLQNTQAVCDKKYFRSFVVLTTRTLLKSNMLEQCFGFFHLEEIFMLTPKWSIKWIALLNTQVSSKFENVPHIQSTL